MLLSAGFALTVALASQLVSDPNRGYSFVLPDGYTEFSEGRAAPHVLQSFMRGQPHAPSFGVLRVETLGGTIGSGPLNPVVVEKAARDSVRGTGVNVVSVGFQKTRWHGFEIDLVATQLTHDNEKLVTLGVQVPLRKEAIQVYFMGPADDEVRLRADLTQILGSLRGESSWLTDDERSERLGFAVGIGVGAIVVISLWFWLRRRRLARGRSS